MAWDLSHCPWCSWTKSVLTTSQEDHVAVEEGRWRVLDSSCLPRGTPIASREWDLHKFICIYSISGYLFYTRSTWKMQP